MKTFSLFWVKRLSRGILFFVTASMFTAGSVRAGLTVDVHLYHDDFGYYFYPWLSANATLPNFPNGVYQIASPQIPANGSRLVYYATNGTISGCYNNDCGGGSYYGTFDSMLYGVTNGLWSITVTNNTSTNLYFFSVAVTGLTSNVFGGPPQAVYPTSGQTLVPNQPVFQWTGPANWAGTLYVQDNFVDTNGNGSFVAGQNLSPAATSWVPGTVLPDGTNQFSVDYQSNVTALVTASQPTNSSGQPISGWTSTSTLEAHFAYGNEYNVTFTVGSLANDYDPFLVARYNFEDTNNPYADSSGNNNYNDCTSSSGTNSDTFSTDAAVGQYARLFFGDTSFCFTQSDPAYQNLSNALSGNFSVTAWVKTTNSVSTDYANAYFGAPIFFAGADYNDDCTIPLSITGSKAAFTIVASEGPGTVTLQSTTSVNDGNYHFLAVTRQQSSGLMSVYVDGNLEATGTGITTPVITQGYISVAGGYYQYAGLLDDVRIYSTNLSAGDVASIHNGGNLPTLAGAIGATNLALTTSGDANWFVETTNTYGGAFAADQSGVISNYQSSTLTATVTGPGKLTFYWSSVDNDPNQNMDYEFAIDDPNTNDIADLYGANGWQSIETTTGGGPIVIPPGQHTLIWTVYANNDADPNLAGFLDGVVFMPPDTGPVSASITLNIYQEQDPTFGDIFIAFPSFNSVTPAGTGTTTNIIQSPDNYFNTHADQGGGGSGSAILFSLGSLLNECTNGLWSLYINKGLANERLFQFSVGINGLTTNLLPAVKMITPTNGATGFLSTAAIQWLGPTNYTSLNASKQNIDGSAYLGTTLPVTATSWTPGLIAGTNRCDISYASNSFPGVSFTVPVDSVDSQTAAVWSAQMNLNTTATTIFVVAAGASPVRLLSPQTGGGNFQFSFQSQTGFTNTVLYRTNLVAGSWLTWTNIPGDGTVKIIPVPLSLFSPSKQGFIRVSTQ
jgi:hypothetical protein